MSRDLTRREFLARGAAGGAALLTAGVTPLFESIATAAKGFPWLEATIADLQAAMVSGALSSRELTQGYLDRIRALNPLLHAVIETNPNAVSIAAQLDNERRAGHVRGPLHGIPVLVKDNIATDDNMQTTAGSLALVNTRVPQDATIIARLRAAGAVILGKSNLGEWANWRGNNPLFFYGWSARGGPTRNPYLLSYSAFGSSAGSGVGVATNLCSVAVGTETDGSITSPSNGNLIVGLKPTLGLVSQRGIIPISHFQDTAGPMGRTVSDVATLLGVLQSPFGEVLGHAVPSDYRPFLQKGALAGKRIGVDRRYLDQFDVYGFPGDADTLPFFLDALQAMQNLGATLFDTDSGDYILNLDNEFTALVYEFKVDINAYLATLAHNPMRTLTDLIAFNLAHCPAEMTFYGQELFEASEATSGDPLDPVSVNARTAAKAFARNGIDGALAAQNLDAIVAPHLTNTSQAAVAGYPNLAVPVGITQQGKPAGLLMYGTFLHEPQLLGFGYDLEQYMKVRVQPQFLGTASDPPDAGICSALPSKPHVFTGRAHLPHGKNL